MLLDVAPLPMPPGLSIPWWSPFVVAGAAVVLIPPIVMDRLSSPRRIVAQPWLGTVPIAGLVLLCWAALDTFALQLSWEDGCLPPIGPPCYRADRGLLALGVAWATLAIAFLVLLVRTILAAQSSRARRGIAPFILVLTILSISVGLGTLPFLGYYGYEPAATVLGWSAFTTGFVAFATATIWANRLFGRWAPLARWLTLAEGIALMTFAFVSVYIAAGPPRRSRSLIWTGAFRRPYQCAPTTAARCSTRTIRFPRTQCPWPCSS